MKKPIKKHFEKIYKNPYALFIILLMLLALFLRIYDLDMTSFRHDEALSSLASIGILENGYPVLPSGYDYYRSFPYHYLMAISFKIFGVSDFSARLVSILFGVLTIPIIYKFGKEIGGKNTGALAAMLVTFSWWNIWMSRDARFYQQFQFFTILSIFFFYLGFVKEKKKYKYLTIPALILCIFTHDLALMLLPAFFLYPLVVKKKEMIKDKIFWVGSVLISLAILLQYLIIHSSRLNNNIKKGKITSTGITKISPFGFSLTNFINYLERLLFPNLFLGMLFAILALIIYQKTKDKKLFFLNFMLWIPLLITIFCLNWYHARYLFYLFALMLLILSYVTMNHIIPKIRQNFKKAGKKFIVFIFTILLISHIGMLLVDIDTYYYNPNADFRGAANYVKEHKNDGDKIIAIYPPLAYYYLEQCDYYMRQWNYTGYVYEKDGKFYDKFTSTELIDNSTELIEVFENENRIWFIVGNEYPSRLKNDIINFVVNEMTLVYIASDNKAKVFFFENPSI